MGDFFKEGFEKVWELAKLALFLAFSAIFLPIALGVNYLYPYWEKWSEKYFAL